MAKSGLFYDDEEDYLDPLNGPYYQDVPDPRRQADVGFGPPPVPVVTGINGADNPPILSPVSTQAPEDRLGPYRAASARHQSDLEALRNISMNPPPAPNPKWWQKALAGAAGGFIGYANAGGRIRPVDPSGVIQAIEAPGWGRKLGDYQRQQQAAAQAAQISGSEAEALGNVASLEASTEEKSARAESERQRGAYWEQKSLQEKNRYKVDPKTGAIYDTQTGEIKTPPRSLEQQMKDRRDALVEMGQDPNTPENQQYVREGKSTPRTEGAHHNATPDDVLLHPEEYSPEIVKRAENMDQRRHPGRQESIGNGRAATATPAQSIKIERDKRTALTAAEAKAKQRIAEGEDPQAVYADLENIKQGIQDTYEAEIEAGGGSTQHVEYGKKKPTQKPVASKFKPGDMVKLKSGQTVTIKRINPDGTFEY